ncbi:MAG: aldehyde dehydrogenase family protein [Planctomycetota bacterium]|nr:aldehyde dehydrogenase family protein [Planctomycetota bacterium]
MNSGLFIGGKWVSGGEPLEVRNKYSGAKLGAVATATPADVKAAVGAALAFAPTMAETPLHKRAAWLRRTSELLLQRKESLGKTIAAEAGKALKFSLSEVERAASTFDFAAEEARRIHGETVPLDGSPAGEGYFGFWLRRPVGVVGAITPFNFPLNLVAHKLAPALAAGNPVVLKPAEQTPLTAAALFEILLEAGVPPEALQLVQGYGEVAGEALVTDPRVAKISFTGSRAVGEHITRVAGIKKVTLELGNTSPVIVAPDADLEYVAKRCAIGAFANSGQVCISVQRIYGAREIVEPFNAQFVKAAEALKVGDPLLPETDVGPLIEESATARVAAWVDEAAAQGAKVLTGGKREGPVYRPTVLSAVRPEMKVVAQEVFGPVASVLSCDNFDSALAQANASDYGLHASIFTQDIDRVLHAVRKLDFGGVVVNEFPIFRVDHMPYGGNKQSGLGREGVRFALEEMTNIQMVVIKLK